MQRLIRFASMTLASLSLALIVLTAISGGEAQAMGISTCGVVSAKPQPDGVPIYACNGGCQLNWIWWGYYSCNAPVGNGTGISTTGGTCTCDAAIQDSGA